MEVEAETSKRVVCPMPCNLASLLSMNCRTRAEGLARRLQSHITQECKSDIEGTWLVQTGSGVRVSTSEGRTYSLDDHQLESFKTASELKGLRPIHVVTSEPTLHLYLPSQASQEELAAKADHEQDSDVYYDFDLVTPPEDYANPGPSRMTSREAILEENEKHERPESGCVTSVTSPVMFSDDMDQAPSNPPSPFDDNCPPELFNKRASEVDFDAVRELLSSSKFGCSFPGSDFANQLSPKELPDERPNVNSCSSSPSSDDVEISLSFYDDDEESLLQPNSHTSLDESRTDLYSPPVSTFQKFTKFDNTSNTHGGTKSSSSRRKRKNFKRNVESLHCQCNSADLSPAANIIQGDPQKPEKQADNSLSKHTRVYANKLPYDLVRSHSLEGNLKGNKRKGGAFATTRSLEKIGKGSCDLQCVKKIVDHDVVNTGCLPELHLQLKANRPGSSDDVNQMPEDVSNKDYGINPFLDNAYEERDPTCEFYLAKDIYRKLVTESHVNSEPPDMNRSLNSEVTHSSALSDLDGTDLINDIDSIIERLKNDGFIGKKLANYEDKQKELHGTFLDRSEMPGENLEQVASSYIGWEIGARDRCQEGKSGSVNCDLCEKQVPFEAHKNVSDAYYEEFSPHHQCERLHENYDLLNQPDSAEKEMPVSGGQIKVKRATAETKQPLSLGIEELSEASGTSFSELLSSKCEPQVRDERGYHEVSDSNSELLFKTRSPYDDTQQCMGVWGSKVGSDGSNEPKPVEQTCCVNKNEISDDLLLDYSPIKSNNFPSIANGSCSISSPDKQCDLYQSLSTLGSDDVDSNCVDLLEGDNNYLKESECFDLRDSGYLELTSSSGTFSVYDESEQNNDTYHKSDIKFSNNPFLKEMVEGFPGETFHLVNGNSDRNIDSENSNSSISNENCVSSQSNDERVLFTKLFKQKSDVNVLESDSPVRNDTPSVNKCQAGNCEATTSKKYLMANFETDLPIEIAQNSLDKSDNNNVEDPESLMTLPDNVYADNNDVTDTKAHISKHEDLISPEADVTFHSEPILNDPSITTNHFIAQTEEPDNSEHFGHTSEEASDQMASQKSDEELPKNSASVAAEGNDGFRSPDRNGSNISGNIFVAIEEPGVLCLVQNNYNDGSTSTDPKENILVRRDSAERDIQVEMEPQSSGAMEIDESEDVIDTLPEDGNPDEGGEEDDSDEEIVLSGKFKNIKNYYAKETIHHISDEDGSLPPPPTEVILIDLDEPVEPPKEEEEELAKPVEVCSTTLADELERLEMAEPSVQPPSSDSERSSEERETGGDLQLRIKRSSSLKCGKTPPGTPGRKKIVRFADALGLDLAAIRTYLDGVPNVPPSAFCDLQVELESTDAASQGQGFPSFASYSAAASAAAAALQNQARRILTPMFQQPGALPDFYDRLREQKVILENVSVGSDLSVKGVVRVINEDFHKKVHVRYTFDQWKNFHEATATYVDGSSDGFSDRFSFLLWGSFLQSNGALIFCVKYSVQNREYWDSNRGSNYVLQCYSAPPIPLSSAPAVEQSQQLLGRPQNHVNIQHREGNGHDRETFHSDFGHQDHQFNSFMDTPNTPADPWIPRFF